MKSTVPRQELFRQTVGADAVGARAARAALQPLLEGLEIEPRKRDALLLAVAELVVNPGQHAQPPATEHRDAISLSSFPERITAPPLRPPASL